MIGCAICQRLARGFTARRFCRELREVKRIILDAIRARSLEAVDAAIAVRAVCAWRLLPCHET